MASIWKQNKDVTQQVKRNNHDLSFDNHCTMKLGYLYPVFKKFVVPGDSFRIRSAFDLKLMPLVFPLQSRMRAHLHFFYVRCKNVWPEIEDYLTGVPRHNPIVEPYLTPSDSDVVTGSIYDFLGVPTTAVTKSPVTQSLVPQNKVQQGEYKCLFSSDTYHGNLSSISTSSCNRVVFPMGVLTHTLSSPDISFSDDYIQVLKDSVEELQAAGFGNIQTRYFIVMGDLNMDTMHYSELNSVLKNYVDFESFSNVRLSDSEFHALNTYISNGHSVCLSAMIVFDDPQTDCTFTSGLVSQNFTCAVELSHTTGFYNYEDLHLNMYRDKIHLKAMPFRAYESIYRAYYANDILQPLIDSNGDAQYNKFCTTTASGQDTTSYHLFKRNYELDFLTSAYPSPQAGPAPLVGISALGNITIEDENGITTAKAVVDESTGQITGVSITSPLASVEHGRTLVNISQAGISINDFRNANALQRFLEQTLRSGYRYIDFIRGQWGVKPKDQALDMPEFIGGFSRDVALQTVTSVADMASSADDPLSKQLGGFAGVGRVLGGSEHAVSKFCDDYGYIIGVMSVTPTPAYSQLLDKQMIAGDNYLSFPFPEFNQLGMQPIPYKEVTPIQAYLDSLEDPTKSLNDTFGYQRPNYDLVGSVDEVHGEFRSTLRNFLINRIFDGRPELGSSFIEIDPSEVNDVFVNQNPDDDVLIGHIRFKVDTKRPFPRIHFPSL